MTSERAERLRNCVSADHDVSLAQLGDKLVGTDGVRLSPAHLARVLKRLGLRLKKLLHARERDTAGNHRRQVEFLAQLGAVSPEKLIFIDESGVTTSMTRLYGRAPGGARPREAIPGGHWKVLTILDALSMRGMIATMTVVAATDRDVFLAYLERVLCPAPEPGQVVVMDNLSSHKVDGVRTLIAQRGAYLLSLPPYSPDLNPIAKAWSKLKALLRATKARTADALDRAITEALPLISAAKAQAWFQLCFTSLSLKEKCSKPVWEIYPHPIGSFHGNNAEVRTVQGKLDLFVTVDRTPKFASTRLLDRADWVATVSSLRALIEAVACWVHTTL